MNTSRTLLRLALPAAVLMSAGCLSDTSAVSITGFEFVSNEDNVCMPSGISLVQGQLDTAAGTTYWVTVKAVNELPDNSDEVTGRVNTNRVTMDAAEVTFRTSEGAPFAAPATERVPVTLTIEPGGEGIAAMKVLSELNGQTLAGATDGYLIVGVRLLGKSGDGAAVASTQAEFPVQLCANCIKPCPPGEEVVAACSPGQADGVVCASAE